ncbi:MAG: hypothetical protein IKN89_10480 [Oscillospiraceae bacterium]|nr:hypothetical protein [Oscillospiraceae bacterium]
MALEELLRQRDKGEEQAAARAELRDKGSLIRQAGELFSLREEDAPASGDEGGEPETVICADGYVRRSPVQPYAEAADYRKRRIRSAVTAAAVICLAVLLIVALVRARVLRF